MRVSRTNAHLLPPRLLKLDLYSCILLPVPSSNNISRPEGNAMGMVALRGYQAVRVAFEMGTLSISSSYTTSTLGVSIEKLSIRIRREASCTYV